MAQVNYSDLPKIRERHKSQKIVFCSGGFDLTHAGHVLFFEDCKKQGDVLVVGVGPDAARRIEKGQDRPILNEHLRLKMVDSLKPADYAFLLESQTDGHNLDPLKKVFEMLLPDVYVVNDDSSDIPYRQTMIKGLGIKMVVLKRWCPPEFNGVSTTNIIKKIRGSK